MTRKYTRLKPYPRSGRMKPCADASCGKEFYCYPWYEERKKFCSLTCYQKNKRKDSDALMWEKVDKNGPNGCWVYSGASDRRGYGRPGTWKAGSRKRIYAHRRSYELLVGPIPAGMLVLHRCDNPPCCNPAHLFLGTDLDNHLDKVAKGRANWQQYAKEGEKK